MLNNGKTIPQFGFGVFQIKPADTVEAVTTALDLGYRHIDTAQMYGNEAEVGEAVAKYDIDRAEVFITSKLNNGFHRPDDARRAFDETLQKLGIDYVDLFLIHWPLPTRYDGDFVSTWKTLEEFYRDGRARSIGVSNFQPHHLRRLHEEADGRPGRQPDRGAPVPDAGRRARLLRRARRSRSRRGRRSRRAPCWTTRPSTRSRGGSARRRPRSCCAGTSSAGTSSSRSR